MELNTLIFFTIFKIIVCQSPLFGKKKDFGTLNLELNHFFKYFFFFDNCIYKKQSILLDKLDVNKKIITKFTIFQSVFNFGVAESQFCML